MIFFIMFSGGKCGTTLEYGVYDKTLEVILRDTYVLHMLFNISCNRPCRSLSQRRNASEKIDKKLQYQKVFLCAARWSPLKKDNEICDNTLCLCHALSRTDGPVVKVMYTGQNLKLNAFRLGLKNISLSNRLDNGQEQKNNIIFFTAVWHGMQLICGSEYGYAIRRVSIIQPFQRRVCCSSLCI